MVQDKAKKLTINVYIHLLKYLMHIINNYSFSFQMPYTIFQYRKPEAHLLLASWGKLVYIKIAWVNDQYNTTAITHTRLYITRWSSRVCFGFGFGAYKMPMPTSGVYIKKKSFAQISVLFILVHNKEKVTSFIDLTTF